MGIAAGKFAREMQHSPEDIAANQLYHRELKAMMPILPQIREGAKLGWEELNVTFKVLGDFGSLEE